MEDVLIVTSRMLPNITYNTELIVLCGELNQKISEIN